MGLESDLQFGYVNCTLVIFSPLFSSVNLLLRSLSLSIFPQFLPSQPWLFLLLYVSLHRCISQQELAQGHALSPRISLWWIFYLAYQVLFSYWKSVCTCPAVFFFTCTPHCETAVTDEVTICLPISGELLIRECRLGLCFFLSTSAHQKGTK